MDWKLSEEDIAIMRELKISTLDEVPLPADASRWLQERNARERAERFAHQEMMRADAERVARIHEYDRAEAQFTRAGWWRIVAITGWAALVAAVAVAVGGK